MKFQTDTKNLSYRKETIKKGFNKKHIFPVSFECCYTFEDSCSP